MLIPEIVLQLNVFAAAMYHYGFTKTYVYFFILYLIKIFYFCTFVQDTEDYLYLFLCSFCNGAWCHVKEYS